MPHCTVKQLHKEFVQAGADVLQSFTYNASESRLQTRYAQYMVSIHKTKTMYKYPSEQNTTRDSIGLTIAKLSMFKGGVLVQTVIG